LTNTTRNTTAYFFAHSVDYGRKFLTTKWP